ncbi:MAG: RNA polymerase subunit sigma [Proteobacteria bacterium]|nr:MAG: RNA polymerase subunit sigma [Pseudomonadota bacterium]
MLASAGSAARHARRRSSAFREIDWDRLPADEDFLRPLSPHPDDATAMDALTRGDADALGRLYDRYGATVLALCLRILRDRAEAEEVLEEVFWELWARRERYDASRSAPFSYLMTLARSRALDRLRFRRRREGVWVALPSHGGVEPAATGQGTDPFEDTSAQQQRAAIDRALEELPAPSRRAVEMNFFEGLSHREIAERLGDPLGTVKTRIRQGLLTLRKALRALDERKGSS